MGLADLLVGRKAEDMADQTVAIDGLVAGYGRLQILHAVSFGVPSGSVAAVVGPNGAGKTTMLRAIMGLADVSSGKITIGGKDVTGWSPERIGRLGVAYIPEGRGIFRGLTVQDNLRMFGRRGQRVLDEQLDRAYDTFPRLAERRGQVAGTMSGGEQQMLAFSRALVADADLILADELSLGLAPIVIDEIFEVLTRVRETGKTVVLVEQYVERALALAEFVYVLNSGTFVFAGEPSELSGVDRLASLYLGGAET